MLTGQHTSPKADDDDADDLAAEQGTAAAGVESTILSVGVRLGG